MKIDGGLVLVVLFFRQLGIVIHVLHVVVVLQHLQQLLNLLDRFFVRQRNRVLRNLVHFSGQEGDALLLQRFADGGEVVRRGVDS